MNDLEKHLREYIDTRESAVKRRIEKWGPVGLHLDVDEPAMIADLRAILDGQPLPARGAA